MFKIICVTNRKLCAKDFTQRMEEIAKCDPHAIVLREKDLSESDYGQLAAKVLPICKENEVTLFLHNFPEIAEQLEHPYMHLPLHILRQESQKKFLLLGSSVHSVEEAIEAESLGCDYIFAGHIFATDCKKGVEPRGISFLEKVCQAVSIPVYAIGGINKDNIAQIEKAGAKGACIMSGLMQCENVSEYMDELSKEEGEKQR